MYNIVTNHLILSEFKKCRYFKISLGLASTVEKNGNRIFNENDKFAYFYNSMYKTTLLGQGNIGDIKFYVDHFIKDPVIAVYTGDDNEEFIFDVDFNIIREKGIDFFIGHILKNVEIQHEERIKTITDKKMEPVKVGNPDIVTLNPGNVSYDDLKAYLDKQNRSRYDIDL